MEITQVTQKSPSVWVLTLADGRSYEIDRTCVLEYALLNRLEIDDETLQEMQQTYCERHALQQALRWLNYRPYTFKAMFQRLMPIYGEATSFAVLKRLTEMGGSMIISMPSKWHALRWSGKAMDCGEQPR